MTLNSSWFLLLSYIDIYHVETALAEVRLQFDFADSEGVRRTTLFTRPQRIIQARESCDVKRALAEVDDAIAAGLYAAGYVTYEAAAGLDDAFTTKIQSETDLVWFGIFRQPQIVHNCSTSHAITLSPWEVDTCAQDYYEMVRAIREAIARGETYQVNLTTRFRTTYSGSPAEFYNRVATSCNAPYCALLETGEQTITSFSPELFFQVTQDKILVRPMKGTAARGRTLADDELAARLLHESVKDRAENLMIVDLMRNDLGRISRPGTVHVTKMFTVEPYPTVWQLTSEVTAQLSPFITLTDIFEALFPCGSITGAPKVAAMRKIAELEESPRGVYCGAVGFAAPNGEATFNVAIRTAVFHDHDCTVSFGAGSGITWDSSPHSEYAETLAKALVVQTHSWEMSLLESMLLQAGKIALLPLHLARMARSAAFFGVDVDINNLVDQLEVLASERPEGDWKVRVIASRTGELAITLAPVLPYPRVPLRAALSQQYVSSTDFRLFHKTTDRSIYTSQSQLYPGYNEVLMQNEKGELTEFLNGNLLLEIEGRMLTPPLKCGLLPGIQREHLLAAGVVREHVLYSHQLESATRLWLINSVRGMVPVEIDLKG